MAVERTENAIVENVRCKLNGLKVKTKYKRNVQFQFAKRIVKR